MALQRIISLFFRLFCDVQTGTGSKRFSGNNINLEVVALCFRSFRRDQNHVHATDSPNGWNCVFCILTSTVFFFDLVVLSTFVWLVNEIMILPVWKFKVEILPVMQPRHSLFSLFSQCIILADWFSSALLEKFSDMSPWEICCEYTSRPYNPAPAKDVLVLSRNGYIKVTYFCKFGGLMCEVQLRKLTV